MRATYVRYCDNIALFLHDGVPEGFTDKFKSFVRETFRSGGFRTHKWNCITDSNPVKNQKFLGVVLNAEARVELAVVDRLRAILFNWCLFGGQCTADRFMSEEGIQLRDFMFDGMKVGKLRQIMRGHINYVKRINSKHGLWLDKLLGAALYLDEKGMPACANDEMFRRVKKYKDCNESYDDFMAGIASITG